MSQIKVSLCCNVFFPKVPPVKGDTKPLFLYFWIFYSFFLNFGDGYRLKLLKIIMFYN